MRWDSVANEDNVQSSVEALDDAEMERRLQALISRGPREEPTGKPTERLEAEPERAADEPARTTEESRRDIRPAHSVTTGEEAPARVQLTARRRAGRVLMRACSRRTSQYVSAALTPSTSRRVPTRGDAPLEFRELHGCTPVVQRLGIRSYAAVKPISEKLWRYSRPPRSSLSRKSVPAFASATNCVCGNNVMLTASARLLLTKETTKPSWL